MNTPPSGAEKTVNADKRDDDKNRLVCDRAPMGVMRLRVGSGVGEPSASAAEDIEIEYVNTATAQMCCVSPSYKLEGRTLAEVVRACSGFQKFALGVQYVRVAQTQQPYRDVLHVDDIVYEIQALPLSAHVVVVFLIDPLRVAHEYVQKVENANMAKTRFLSEISHELRTPANTILGSLDLLVAQQDASVENPSHDLLTMARRNCQNFVTLLDDLIDTASIEEESIKITPRDFNLFALCHEVLDAERQACANKHLKFLVNLAPTCPSHTHADPKRIRQVLTNLIHNAAKYTAQGTVLLDVSLSYDHVLFRVSDTGQGFDLTQPGLKDSLFQRFSRLPQHRRSATGGKGLGLWICYKLAKLMHGNLDVESRPGCGSTFTLTIPHTNCASGQPTRPCLTKSLSVPEPVRRHYSARVLVVEDIADNQVIFTKMLEHFGVHADVANNGREGVHRWWRSVEEKTPYDFVLMDSFMPVMSGKEAAVAIREQEAQHGFDRITIIGCSANVIEGKQECLDAGMDDYLVKPVHLSMLEKVLEQTEKRKKMYPMTTYNRLLAEGVLDHICSEVADMMT